MKRLLLLVPAAILTGCLASGIMESDDLDSRFDPAQRLSPTAFEQNATMKDTSVHEDPSLMRVGVTRDQIAAAFGKPNETSDQAGQVQDVYEFNPDGSKFVKPKVYARIHATEQQLTVYRLTYGPDGIVQSVQKESRHDDSNAGGAQPPPNP
jgi:outer membrane protein assembly factor BamE (lipoprotein component of BamABCDE complex)